MAYYELTTDISHELTVALLMYYWKVSKYVSFVIPIDNYQTKQCTYFLSEFLQLGGKKKRVSEWPGTQLLWGDADFYFAPMSQDVFHLVLQATKTLFSWKQPENPEDICLYNEFNSPVLLSTTHEEYAKLCLTDQDINNWREDQQLSQILTLLERKQI